MPNVAATVAALDHYLGFPAKQPRQAVRRLLEAKLLTPGGPGKAVEITEADFALLLLAVASGASMPTVADVTVSLAECVPSGIDVDVMPASTRPAKRTVLDVLTDVIWNAGHGDGSVKFDIEVCETWPEVSFHTSHGVARFVPPGEDTTRWQSGKQRRTTRIPHTALFLAARNLFGDN